MVLVIAVITFLTIALLVVGIYGGQARQRQVVAHRLSSLSGGQGAEAGAPAAPSLLRSPLGRRGLLSSRGASKTLRELEQAGLPLRVNEYILIRFAAAIVLFLLFMAATRSPLVAMPAAVIGLMLPRWYVSLRRKSRLSRINSQLGELLTLLSNSLKSGYGLMQSIEFAATQMTPPLASELKRLLRDVSLGVPTEAALAALNERVGSADADMMVTAIAIHRSVGGNLAEILDNVAFTIRERERLRGEVRTLTAQQRMTGIVIGFLPIGVGLLFYALNPDYMSPLFITTAGRVMLAAAVGLELVGWFLMRKILAIEI